MQWRAWVRRPRAARAPSDARAWPAVGRPGDAPSLGRPRGQPKPAACASSIPAGAGKPIAHTTRKTARTRPWGSRGYSNKRACEWKLPTRIQELASPGHAPPVRVVAIASRAARAGARDPRPPEPSAARVPAHRIAFLGERERSGVPDGQSHAPDGACCAGSARPRHQACFPAAPHMGDR
jgi:hypothetical protein